MQSGPGQLNGRVGAQPVQLLNQMEVNFRMHIKRLNESRFLIIVFLQKNIDKRFVISISSKIMSDHVWRLTPRDSSEACSFSPQRC